MNTIEQYATNWLDAKLNPFVEKKFNQQQGQFFLQSKPSTLGQIINLFKVGSLLTFAFFVCHGNCKELQVSIGFVQTVILAGLVCNPTSLARVNPHETGSDAGFVFGIAAIASFVAAGSTRIPGKFILMMLVQAFATLSELNNFLELGQTKIDHTNTLVETEHLPKDLVTAKNASAAVMTLRICTMLLIITTNYRSANLLLTVLSTFSSVAVLKTTCEHLFLSSSTGSFFEGSSATTDSEAPTAMQNTGLGN